MLSEEGVAAQALTHVPLTWAIAEDGTYLAMLGAHLMAQVLPMSDGDGWRWRITNCNGEGQSDFQSSSGLEEAKRSVQAGIETWFRDAGLLCEG
ncbi:hypothetical protein BTR14_01210 [Rhizobium rhizosphaerae]|uniref:Uncharacterized protein n=1 Tax=Xaviernesmea rhizosphaerae TaxID=1672749 RepID=A0ABX3PJ09_9HYPH|nr:hypothetical protein [Xaviernesmea rhizosphaerae]OQP88118.1 hypothetical protein BTR14_01210 [Xaviernesmea rhizosphaerae]